jgi:DNA-binding NarL/FixJ family response regulator
MTKRTIYLVDDHPLVRDGLSRLIAQEADLCVCGEAEDAATALAGFESLRPDAAIVDLTLKGSSGLDLVRNAQELARPPAILVLSMHDDSFYAERAIRAGALGYVMKRESSGRIIGALRKILAGDLFVSEAVAKQAAEKFLRNRPGGVAAADRLTDREIEIFRRIGQGHENRRIAEDLHLSLKTVQTHCAHIKDKLGLENAALLMREAVRWVERGP